MRRRELLSNRSLARLSQFLLSKEGRGLFLASDLFDALSVSGDTSKSVLEGLVREGIVILSEACQNCGARVEANADGTCPECGETRIQLLTVVLQEGSEAISSESLFNTLNEISKELLVDKWEEKHWITLLVVDVVGSSDMTKHDSAAYNEMLRVCKTKIWPHAITRPHVDCWFLTDSGDAIKFMFATPTEAISTYLRFLELFNKQYDMSAQFPSLANSNGLIRFSAILGLIEAKNPKSMIHKNMLGIWDINGDDVTRMFRFQKYASPTKPELRDKPWWSTFMLSETAAKQLPDRSRFQVDTPPTHLHLEVYGNSLDDEYYGFLVESGGGLAKYDLEAEQAYQKAGGAKVTV